MQEPLYSAQYLLKHLKLLRAERVNVYTITRGSRELDHFVNRTNHPARNLYTDIGSFTEFVEKGGFLKSEDYVCVSTTFGTSSNGYRAFIGLDVEIDNDKTVFDVTRYIANKLNTPIDVFKTLNSFHLFIPDLVFDNDFEYIQKLMDVACIAASYTGDDWVQDYYRQLTLADSYKSVQDFFVKILSDVGHCKEKGIYTFFDLRHIAHGVIEYERSRGQLYNNDGVRAQLFFRVTKKSSGSNIPYFIRRFV